MNSENGGFTPKEAEFFQEINTPLIGELPGDGSTTYVTEWNGMDYPLVISHRENHHF